MRILHVAALITPDGAYGGPVRVATNQVRELRRLGHDVTLIAGHRGFGLTVPNNFDGVDVRLFRTRQYIPGSGFLGLMSFEMVRWIRSHADRYDAIHVHLGRDLLTLSAAKAVGRDSRLIVQTHGMVAPTSHLLAELYDRILTRPTLQKAHRVLFLTARERKELEQVARRDLMFQSVPNGISSLPEVPSKPVADASVEVLYLARMHPRKRPEMFAKSALALQSRFPEVRFTMIGPDEGSGPALAEHLAAAKRTDCKLDWEGALNPSDVVGRMASADIYVLPSVDEPFPMSVLEAMSLGKPVVITRSCGLASAVEDSGAGIVVSESQEALDFAIVTLLDDAQLRTEMGNRARELVAREFSITSVAHLLESVYRQPVDVP